MKKIRTQNLAAPQRLAALSSRLFRSVQNVIVKLWRPPRVLHSFCRCIKIQCNTICNHNAPIVSEQKRTVIADCVKLYFDSPMKVV